MRIVDMRSDTITKPTPAMRRAMAEAEVGDDVFGEDPTISRLQDMAAERLGKEAGLFVASGTMGNLTSLLAHCGRGDEAIIGDQAHLYFYEAGGMATLGGIHPRPIRNEPDGTMDLKSIEEAIRPDNVHFPRTRLIALENTHNRCNGSPLTLEYMDGVRAIADRYGLKVHLDGARLFNAAVASGIEAREFASRADSVTFCLSKGLAAPAGSVVCGTQQFINEARRVRKAVGGGMRQAGVLAAAGIVALTEMVDRLAEDHANARRLAEGVAEIPGLSVNLNLVKTNIVFVDIERKEMDSGTLVDRLKAGGVLAGQTNPHRIRVVMQYHVSRDDVDYALGVFR
ncbi:MAG: low-specificity L-threonine aldolase, partial [Desulfobacteraceae bacterium]|nr:low-specificity L-threonine aldolase [Desulfobacteraceae bacterium]